MIDSLGALQGRRKAFIYISNGYDLNPYAGSRAKLETARLADLGIDVSANPFASETGRFAEADLAAQLAELTRAANRANVSIYTIDPRGLVAGPDIDAPVDQAEWQQHVTATQSSLRVLAELTGGIAAVNQNDLSRALARIDADTSDYYMLGYYSSNPDPSRRRRQIEIKVTRPGIQTAGRREYVLPPVAR
jgi:VWFA-related protein